MAGLGDSGLYVALGEIEFEGMEVIGIALWLADAMRICERDAKGEKPRYSYTVEGWELGATTRKVAWVNGPGTDCVWTQVTA